MKSIKKQEWCIALDNIGSYTDPVLGLRYKFLKGERATKEKVFNMIPDMTEEEYARCFRPATEEEINGEFNWDGEQYVLKSKHMDLPAGSPDCPIQTASELEVEQKWNTLRNQAAIAAMQGVMNFFGSIDYKREIIARLAVEQANALIEELRKEK